MFTVNIQNFKPKNYNSQLINAFCLTMLDSLSVTIR